MEDKLGNKAQISTGLAHKRYEDTNGQTYNILTLRSIKNIEIDTMELDEFTSKEEINTKYLTKKDDVIIGLFSPYSATIIREETENIIVPQSFAIIRTEKINPEYLAYYLNSKRAKYEIKRRSSGTIIPKISIKKLKEIPIKEINQEEESKFIELMNLLNRRIAIKTKELKLTKEIQTYYLNQIGE
ncbi:MAG: hypothetical protein E7Z84_06615 [Methanosphaera stadtmanae]|nr:hypothetical protein [Methanosphaera stadtmanae]